MLEPNFVRQALGALLGIARFSADEAVLDVLRSAAREVLPALVTDRLRKAVNDKIVSAIHLGGDPLSENTADALKSSVDATFSRLELLRGSVDYDYLQAEAKGIENSFLGALDDGSWVKEFPGRSILKRFAATELIGKASYEAFRNLIIDQMVDAGYEPPGMRQIIDVILSSDESSAFDNSA